MATKLDSIELIDKRIKWLQGKINSLRNQREAYVLQQLKAALPFDVGDVIEVHSRKHRGGLIWMAATVKKIYVSSYGEPEYLFVMWSPINPKEAACGKTQQTLYIKFDSIGRATGKDYDWRVPINANNLQRTDKAV